jgi:NAD(P)-dependent dehydrogenase (short-subunit alcohol dehydrogenase family)
VRLCADGYEGTGYAVDRQVTSTLDFYPKSLGFSPVPDRAAIVTGASRGIGFALAETLGEEGFALTITARRAETLQQAATRLRDRGFEVEEVVANLNDEEGVREVVERHRERYGRLDVLVNNAGVGIGAPASAHQTKHIDLQLDVNLRAIILFYRECADLLRAAGAEHRNALVINMSSIAGKSPQAWLSVYSATKAAVAAYSVSMNKELAKHGVKSVAFAPGFVDTDMSDYIKDKVPAEEMLRTSDVAEGLRFVLRVSPTCLIPEIVFQRPGEIV